MKILKNLKSKIFSREKDGTIRRVKILGLRFVYDKANQKTNRIAFSAKLKNVTLEGGARIHPHARIETNFPKNKILIGHGSHIGRGTVISTHNHNSKIKIGKNCSIGFYNDFYGQGGLELGDYVLTASNVCILTSNHGFVDVNTPIKMQESSYAKTSIGDSTWLGYNVIVLAGVKIGKHCVIGAGSVVTKDIPDYSVAVGNPCRVIKQYNFETSTWENVKSN